MGRHSKAVIPRGKGMKRVASGECLVTEAMARKLLRLSPRRRTRLLRIIYWREK